MKKHLTISNILRLTALILALLLVPVFAVAEEAPSDEGWVSFFLLCNEGMTNEGGNVGNTMMVVSMNPEGGDIRLMMFAFDTFVDYEGYDVPQLIGMPYRNNGPESTMEVFNTNFGTDIHNFISLNYMNLAALIDDYGGVNVDISRAERNALNGMVASKRQSIQKQADSGLLTQLAVELLAKEYYLSDFGRDTHLNGLQAVGYGWLQYDSVYSCCQREVNVNADLFESIARTINEKVVFYDNHADYPEGINNRRVINLDEMSDDDVDFLLDIVHPIFQMTSNNLSDEDIKDISMTLARIAYHAAREGVDIFRTLKTEIFPLEAKNEYDVVAGTQGHLVDYEANGAAMKQFLYGQSET